jgi:hypothetical protein
MDIGSFAAMASSLKAAGDITKAMLGLRDTALIQAKVIELQREIMSAQSSALAANAILTELQQRHRDLEKKLADLEGWEREKARYRLTDYGGKTFAYDLKPDHAEGEPPHTLCPSCFTGGKKAILQFRSQNGLQQQTADCPLCDRQFQFGEPQHPPSSITLKAGHSWLGA